MQKLLKSVEVEYSKKKELEYFNKDVKRHLTNALPILKKLGIANFIEVADNKLSVDEQGFAKLEVEAKSLKGNERILVKHLITSIRNIFASGVDKNIIASNFKV